MGLIDTIVSDTSPTFFSGWRPLIGWVSVTGLFLQFVAIPLIEIISPVVGHPITPPHMDLSALVTLITGTLGLGGFRTIEKIKNVATR